MRRFGVLGGGLVLAVVTLAGHPGRVLAGNPTANCDGDYASAFGATLDTQAVTGYYSHLDPQTMLLCTNFGIGHVSGSFSWAAIQREQSSCSAIDGCPRSIVQIGRGACLYAQYPGECDGPSQRVFVAFGRDTGAAGCEGLQNIGPVPLNRAPAPTDTGLHYYRVWTDGTLWRYDHWPKGQTLTQVFKHFGLTHLLEPTGRGHVQ